tara:strand:+ start:149 stop:430 length:282 start_codon:yes stop_codon:yes gene_type:complete
MQEESQSNNKNNNDSINGAHRSTLTPASKGSGESTHSDNGKLTASFQERKAELRRNKSAWRMTLKECMGNPYKAVAEYDFERGTEAEISLKQG